MTLIDAIAATGMTPPRHLSEGKWLRFPGIGKGRSNRSGWCRIISPTLAIFGDWSSGLTQTWRDDSHRDDEFTKRLLDDARRREREFQRAQIAKQADVAQQAKRLIEQSTPYGHPYLTKKGFPSATGLVHGEHLVVPVRDVDRYSEVITAQLIDAEGTKKFLTGGRARGGVYRFGSNSGPIVLCEGYATGLSIEAALKRLYRAYMVIVCFSARNLELVAERFPVAVIAADNDASRTGEESAKRTGLRWTMPSEVGTDFNDVMLKDGLVAVIRAMREVITVH